VNTSNTVSKTNPLVPSPKYTRNREEKTSQKLKPSRIKNLKHTEMKTTKLRKQDKQNTEKQLPGHKKVLILYLPSQ